MAKARTEKARLVSQISDLIDEAAKALSDDDFLEFLEEMEELAKSAHDARTEELSE